MDLETRLRTIENILQHLCRSRRLNTVKQELVNSLDAAIKARKEESIEEIVLDVVEKTAKEKVIEATEIVLEQLVQASTQTT